MLDAVAESAARLCEGEDASIFQVDGDRLRPVAHYGCVRASEGRAITRGFTSGRAVVDRETVHIVDARAVSEDEFPEVKILAGQYGMRTTLATPLLRQGVPLGVILIRRTEVRPFTDKQIVLLETFANQAAIAIENARLFRELQERNRDLTEALERQTATAEILRVISSSPTDLQPVLEAVAESAMRLTDASGAIIHRVEDGLLRRVAASSTFRPLQYFQNPDVERPLSRDWVTGRAVVDRKVVHVHDLTAEGEEFLRGKAFQAVHQNRTMLAVPLLREGEAIGVIGVSRIEARPFTAGQIELIKTFADQAVIAIENVRLFTELEARTRELARSVEELRGLGEVGQAVSSTLDHGQVLNTVVSHADRLSGTDGGVLYECDEAAREIRLRAARQFDAGMTEALRAAPIRLGEGAIGQAALSREPVQIPDIAASGAYEGRLRDTMLAAGHRAVLAVPLLREDRILGGLVVVRKTPGAFPPNVIDLVRTFAGQSALAIQNARLYREIEEKSTQLEVVSRHKSEFLANMSHELRTPLSAVIGFSEVLQERIFGDLNEKQAEYLSDILTSGQHLLSLINDILDLSKVEVGRMDLELGTFSLREALENGLTMLKERAGRHGIALGLEIDPELDVVEADERKQVTVLFADLKGSTELIRDRDPEEAQALLDGAVTAMMQAVHRYEGTVNQILGDGIMALFGAPVAHEDHAVRACRAALAIREAVRRFSGRVRRVHGLDVLGRVGLNSGEVVVRTIANDLRLDYSAVGPTVHLAARMEQTATPDTILLTPATLRLAEGFVEARPLGAVSVKGVPEPMEVFELVGSGAARTRFEALAARGLTRFVGRDAELETFRAALEGAAGVRGQIFALVGEPGVGKSRLVREAAQMALASGWRVLETGAVSYGMTTPYLPVADLLKTYFRLEARDDPDATRRRVAEGLLALDSALEPDLPALLALLDLGADDPAWRVLDPSRRRRQTLDAVKRLLLRECREQPLLLVFEDLHWIDPETQALLDSLIESLPAARVLLLVNYRPEYEHRWGNKTYYTQLRVDPLPQASADELLEALLGHDPSLDDLKRLLVQRTEGTPLFLEESARALIETGALLGEPGGYRLAGPLADVRVPASVQAVLAARIDRLPPEDKRLLQTAAVIGKDVPLALLRPIAEADGDELERGLAHLRAAELVYEAGLFPEPGYTFKHALTHDVAYGSLLQERRRRLHAAIVETIEAAYADRLGEQAERLAHHASRGEVWDKALRYCRQAGEMAYSHSANREAIAHLEQVLAALSHLPESREMLEQSIDLRLRLRHAYFLLAEPERGMELLREAERLAGKIGDRGRSGWASSHLCNQLWMIGRPAEARAAGEDALAIGEALGDPVLAARAWYYLGQSYLTIGDYPRAETANRRVLELLEGEAGRGRLLLTGFPVAIARGWLARCLADRVVFDEGLAHGREGLRVAEAAQHPFSQCHTRWHLAHLHTVRGALKHAVRLLEGAVALAREFDLRVFSPFLDWSLGHAYARSGRHADGIPMLRRGLEAFDAAWGGGAFRALILVQLAESELLAGRREAALAAACEGLTLARQRGQGGWEALALHLLGELASESGAPYADAAESQYARALTLAEELGMQPVQAHCHLGLGSLYRRVGRADAARAELTTASEMYRSMGMAFWLPRAEAELVHAGGPSLPRPPRGDR